MASGGMFITLEGEWHSEDYIKKLALKMAQTLGIVGNVKVVSGVVEIKAEGFQDDLDMFFEHLKKGNQWAKVKSAKQEEAGYSGEFKEFLII